MRLQILATEHWSLLASRNLAWNESFSGAAGFALALAAQWWDATRTIAKGVANYEPVFPGP